MSAPFTLRYFNAPGQADTARLLLTAAKVEWTEEKPEEGQQGFEEWYGTFPIMAHSTSEDDIGICDFVTIERYLARTYGFLPADPLEAAKQEHIRERLTEVLNAFVIQCSASDDKKDELVAKFKDMLANTIKLLSMKLDMGTSSGHYFGDALTYADIASYAFFKYMIITAKELQGNVSELIMTKLTPQLDFHLRVIESHPLLVAETSKSEMFMSVLPN
ncbi:hypothetical protein H4S07_004276 [Coemansia furcata]|uniref:Uncharacterized protein n=1 Tax=Coemansia furcata TaxID=417177 RepID=A0ACC1L9P0_9FUNG|nr:hypothetical protein H4S07_004276 [Coemansia furcata]